MNTIYCKRHRGDKVENISKNLDENIKHMKDVFKNDNTFISRSLETGGGLRCCAFFCDGMVSTPVVNEAVIKPLVLWDDKIPEGQEISFLKTRILQANDIKIAKTFEDIYLGILYGDTAVLCEGADMALVINTKGFALRSISEPGSEKIVTGPKEGFTEGIMQNISLVRRKLKTPKLKFSFSNLGDVSNTICCVCYIDGIADENVLQKVKHRLSQVKIDGIMSSSYIEEMIADKRLPLFDLMGKTERPDVLAAKLLEGRVAVMVDGTPVALTAPCIIAEQFQSPEDYYVNPFYASFLSNFSTRYVMNVNGSYRISSSPVLPPFSTTMHILSDTYVPADTPSISPSSAGLLTNFVSSSRLLRSNAYVQFSVTSVPLSSFPVTVVLRSSIGSSALSLLTQSST